MGEVYRARDTRLGREVAVKVLPEDVAGSAERRERFEREARAVAALSHPNILALHDVGHEGEVAYAVLELLEGETLRQRLSEGPLPLRKAVDYAVQTARGLAAAHEKGIVHRDLKPENLFVTRDGRVAILDFGLVRETSAFATDDDTRSPTLSPPTDPGKIVGTVGYMSPEQVRGETVDARSDIFSLGAVLYEMLAGRRAFQRETGPETLTAILREDAAPLEGASESAIARVPVGVERIVARCLEKRREERFQSARDLGFALEATAVGSATTTSSGVEAVPPPRATSPLRRAFPLLWLVAGLVAGVLFGRGLAPTPVVEPARVRPLTFSGSDLEPVASPDGRLVAFSSARDGVPRVWIKQLQGGGEAPLTEGPDSHPRFSPDGSLVLFVRDEGTRRSLYRIGLVGGAPRRLAEDVLQADWFPDGERVAVLRSLTDRDEPTYTLGVREVESGQEGVLLESEGQSLYDPRVSPDGRELAVIQGSIIGNSRYQLLVVDVESGEAREVTAPSFTLGCVAWSGDGREIVLARAGSVTGDAAGVPGRIFSVDAASGAERSLFWRSGLFPLTGVGRRFGTCDVLAPGSLVFDEVQSRQTLREVGVGERGGSARILTAGSSSDRQPAYSPDGSRVVFSSNRSGNLDLWSLDRTTGALRQLTDDPAQDWDPGFTPDGRQVIWSSDRSGNLEIWVANADGTGARQLSQDGATAENPTATPDGEWIIYASGHPEKVGLWKIRMDGTEATRLVPGSTLVPEVSPDGRHVLFIGNVGPTRREVRVARVDTGELESFGIDIRWSAAVSSQILWGRSRWRPDGGAIYFVGLDEHGRSGVFVQDFAPGRETRSTRRPVAGFSPEYETESLGLSVDGARLTISTLHQTSGLALAEGLAGVTPPRPDESR
jgi:Tol biopolymer transport system component